MPAYTNEQIETLRYITKVAIERGFQLRCSTLNRQYEKGKISLKELKNQLNLIEAWRKFKLAHHAQVLTPVHNETEQNPNA